MQKCATTDGHDFMIVIDSSVGVGSQGWDAEANFAAQLIDGIMAEDNPLRHRIGLYYFHSGVRAVGRSCKKLRKNDVCKFSSDHLAMTRSIRRLVGKYSQVRGVNSDHADAFFVGRKAFEWNGATRRPQVFILISGSKTVKAERSMVKNMQENPQKVKQHIGDCSKSPNHPCALEKCNKECLTVQLQAAILKDSGVQVKVVGISNPDYAPGSLRPLMEGMATSPGDYYESADFQSLMLKLHPLLDSLCNRSSTSIVMP